MNVSTRRIGSADVTVFDSGHIQWHPHFKPGQEWVTADTVVDDEGRAVLGINGLLIQTSDATILVDPNSLAPDEQLATATLHVGADIVSVLDAVGVGEEDVTHVLISHAHDDHYSALADGDRARFPNAKVYFPAADWQRYVVENATGKAEHMLRYLGPVERAGLLELVEGELEPAPGVTLMPTPGETVAHQIVRFESGGERLYYLGDLFHMPIEFQRLDWLPSSGRDEAELLASRHSFLADADGSGATMVFTHGRFPPWGVVEPAVGDDGWVWRYT